MSTGDRPARVTDYTWPDMKREIETKAPFPEDIYDIRNKTYCQDVAKRARAELRNVKIRLREHPGGYRGGDR
jgi:hypothetical protein